MKLKIRALVEQNINIEHITACVQQIAEKYDVTESTVTLKSKNFIEITGKRSSSIIKYASEIMNLAGYKPKQISVACLKEA